MIRITTPSKRITELISILEISSSEFSRKTGIKKSALSNYKSGTREPRLDIICSVADTFKINPSWLLGYDTYMYEKDS